MVWFGDVLKEFSHAKLYCSSRVGSLEFNDLIVEKAPFRCTNRPKSAPHS